MTIEKSSLEKFRCHVAQRSQKVFQFPTGYPDLWIYNAMCVSWKQCIMSNITEVP